MQNFTQHYINGTWVDGHNPEQTMIVNNPANMQPIAQITLGNAQDVDDAVTAAKAAHPAFSKTSVEQRREWLQAFIEAYKKQAEQVSQILSQEMGAPITLARRGHSDRFVDQFRATLEALDSFEFTTVTHGTRIDKESIGVVGLITPWNWPLNQIACKIGPAIAAGCTMVLKPSEIAPLNAILIAQIIDQINLPNGVFNLVLGTGETVGQAIAAHPDVAAVSFTGSTRAGIAVAKTAADSVKRVCQELGGKSPNIICPNLSESDFQIAITHAMQSMMVNCGQSCNAPSRLLLRHDQIESALPILQSVIENTVIGDPADPETQLGPLASRMQFDKVQNLIQAGIGEGAQLALGGLGRPQGCSDGYFVKPTVFTHVSNDMQIAREEIFGPVLTIIGYDTLDEALTLANDTVYGLSAYVYAADQAQALTIARQLHAGNIHVNGAPIDLHAPFGGYKQSGNGRERGHFGLEDFLEVKAILGLENACNE